MCNNAHAAMYVLVSVIEPFLLRVIFVAVIYSFVFDD